MISAARSSDSANVGTSGDSGTESGLRGSGWQAALVSSASSSCRVCLSMNARSGATPSWNAWAWVLVPFRYGWMPAEFIVDTTGPIMNRLRNRARPASTWLGGTLVRPSALRVSDSTTKIFVKLVHSSSRAGATDSTVSASMMTIELLGLPDGPDTPLTPTVTVLPELAALPEAGPAGPAGPVSPAGAAAASRVGWGGNTGLAANAPAAPTRRPQAHPPPGNRRPVSRP